MSGRERERRLREAVVRLVAAYGRSGRAQDAAVKHAQRVLVDTEDKAAVRRQGRLLKRLDVITNWNVPTLGSKP